MPELSYEIQARLSKLPGVDAVLEQPVIQDCLEVYPRILVVTAIRSSLSGLRNRIRRAPDKVQVEELAVQAVALAARAILLDQRRRKLQPVVNASGIIVHTNLGRSVLGPRALRAVIEAAGNYSNLEYDLRDGKRGSRTAAMEELLTLLTGAPAATAVNNNAAAVLLVLDTFARGREVIVSRGELVEIGGRFRIPDVMSKAEARLVEVGTTNKTRLADYAKAITPDTAMIMKVHRSNFAVTGFTEEVEIRDLVSLASRHNLLLYHDLGSGNLFDMERAGLPAEPLVTQSLREGSHLISFSGDKLLGGPQAGIILGRASRMRLIKENPLIRALRLDKMTLAALTAVLEVYLAQEDIAQEIPTLGMLQLPAEAVGKRARRLAQRLQARLPAEFAFSVIDGSSYVGGGAMPHQAIPTKLLAVHSSAVRPRQLQTSLRLGSPPIIARVHEDQLLLDLRTVPERRDQTVFKALIEACRSSERGTPGEAGGPACP